MSGPRRRHHLAPARARFRRVARVMDASRDEEYAEAYRRGYERARPRAEPTIRLDRRQLQELVEPRAQAHHVRGGTLRAAAGLVVLSVILVGGAFGVGRLLADTTAGVPGPADAVVAEDGSPARQQAYRGPVSAIEVARSSATCRSGSSVDAAGNPVTYEPAKAHDSDLTTAWRCDGSGVGQRFTVSLPEELDVAEVGLVPGYAKTDPASGADRYAENNRITAVRWHFDDGTTFEQRMDGDPADRTLRTMRLPVTETGQVVIEILASQRGTRDTVAISEIRVATPAGT